MSKKTDYAFLREAKELLELDVDQYGVMPVSTIDKIRSMVIDLEIILGEDE